MGDGSRLVQEDATHCGAWSPKLKSPMLHLGHTAACRWLGCRYRSGELCSSQQGSDDPEKLQGQATQCDFNFSFDGGNTSWA